MKIPETCGSTRVDESRLYFDCLHRKNEEQKITKSKNREEPTDDRR